MLWIEPQYSKKSVRRAGDYLIGNRFETDKLFEALGILDNWRSSHAYPLQTMLGYYRKKAFEVDPNAVVVKRLKRTPSILAKLKREDGMKLERMEDIGGCRIVVSNINQVYQIRNAIVEGRTRNILHRERNYISKPKSSGYRGIHLVYRYNGSKRQFSSHFVELQIRSNVQHSWATAVEVVGTFTGESLKASKGHDAWLNFFKLASVAFADIEEKVLEKNANTKDRHDLIKYIERLNVLPRLRAFAVSAEHIENLKNKGTEYFLLLLEVDKSSIGIFRYPKNQLDSATKKYSELEKEFKENSKKDVVLVSAESIKALKKAYPNYFADTTAFSRNIKKIIEANRAWKRTTF